MDQDVESAIRRVADRHQIDPALMMAIAERESSFNPRAGSGSPYSSAYGLFQLLKGERAKYGGSSNDPEEQAEAWANYFKPVQGEMARVLGREPTGPEAYLGHYVGGTRAARIVSGAYDPQTAMEDVFTPREMAANPNFAKAGTLGNFSSSVLKDIDRRTNKFGGAMESGAPAQSGAPDFSQYSEAAEPQDFSQFSEPVRDESHLKEADEALGLNKQEADLYKRHLDNLYGPGGVNNADGSRSSLYQGVQEHNGKFYNIPTVWDGKREVEPYTRQDGTTMDVPNAKALANVDKAGWDTFPSYKTPDEADERYDQMHGFMEKDTQDYLSQQPQPPTQ